ncbi:uncharacterized protein [Oncorhynchus clarkii lewisi]|uniref:uncharacterized protein n=1 Tax=Oncorhynchus clarkii lewisi TaxID=490388 RepID=UPI0039B9649F
MGAVVRALEAVLYRLSGESWQQHDMTAAHCHTDTRECELHTGYTQFSSANMTKPASGHETGPPPHDLVHLQSTAPCLSEQDLSKLVAITPLSRTLQEIQESLQNLSGVDRVCIPARNDKTTEDPAVHLIPVALDNLSPQHFAIFLFGCHVVKLLCNTQIFPPVLLLLSKTVPVSAYEGLVSHCSGDFYFDTTNQILYLCEAKLESVGQFIATLLQSMAYIASGSKPESFMQVLHHAISALSLQLFNASFRYDANKAKRDTSLTSDQSPGKLVEDFLNVRVPTDSQFTRHLLSDRLQRYKYFNVEQIMRDLKQFPAEDTEKGPPQQCLRTPVQAHCLEKEMDHLNEVFLQLSVQLQKRTQGATAEKALSRNGTMMLELKRRYVSQRLDELQIILNGMSRRQLDGHSPEEEEQTRDHPHPEPDNYRSDGQEEHDHSPDQEDLDSRVPKNHKLENNQSPYNQEVESQGPSSQMTSMGKTGFGELDVWE